MPSFSPFQKPPETEPGSNNPFGSPELQRQRYDAAMEFAALLQEAVPAELRTHAGTVLSLAAWLAGTSLHRSLQYRQDAAPGTLMLCSEVEAAWQELMDLFLFYCRRNGIELQADQLIPFTPQEHKPRIDVLQAQEMFQDRYNGIMRKHGLNFLDGARAGVIICAMEFYYRCTHVRDVEPAVAAGIVSLGILSGARTVPLPSKPEGTRTVPAHGESQQNNHLLDVMISIAQNSTTGAGTRLVLGEGRASMQEALNRGGKYILVHPDVLNLLRANNIDAFLVYAAAMQREIASGIPQIDFAGADVERVLQQWSGAPETETPIHVRQIKWLKDHAGTSGYEQRGNSWVRAG